jgi:hypothetical protein
MIFGAGKLVLRPLCAKAGYHFGLCYVKMWMEGFVVGLMWKIVKDYQI